MELSADTMRLLLLLTILGMALIAAFYLRRRELSDRAYLAWGLLAILLPLLGPFLVILYHPGRLRQEFRSPHPRGNTPSQQAFSASLHRLGKNIHNRLEK